MKQQNQNAEERGKGRKTNLIVKLLAQYLILLNFVRSQKRKVNRIKMMTIKEDLNFYCIFMCHGNKEVIH